MSIASPSDNFDFDEAYILAYEWAQKMLREANGKNASLLSKISGSPPKGEIVFSWKNFIEEDRAAYMKNATSVLLAYFGCPSPASLKLKNIILQQAFESTPSPADWAMQEVKSKAGVYYPSYNEGKNKDKTKFLPCHPVVDLLPFGLLLPLAQASIDLKNYQWSLNHPHFTRSGDDVLVSRQASDVLASDEASSGPSKEILLAAPAPAPLTPSSLSHRNATSTALALEASRLELEAQKMSPSRGSLAEDIQDPLEDLKKRLNAGLQAYRETATARAMQQQSKPSPPPQVSTMPPFR